MESREEDRERLFYMGTGPLVAILLGMALVPIRDLTTPCNFTFAFLVLTIAVAELGGRWPALATALSSALSLDFLLTQPYLKLTIAGKHDIIALLGFGVCGLIAALLGSKRRERIREMDGARRHLDFLHAALSRSERGGALEARLAALLEAARNVFPIARVVVRDSGDRVLAASPPMQGIVKVPDHALELESLSTPGHGGMGWLRRSPPLPTEGGRLDLVFDDRQIGWLDVWGNGRPASGQSRRSLSDFGRFVALLLGGATAGSARERNA
jgi:hypothetical protein